jgi:hypothetical protein
MKELTVVFPIHITPDGVVKILMGKKAPGTKLVGFRNGYGGKCEEKIEWKEKVRFTFHTTLSFR